MRTICAYSLLQALAYLYSAQTRLISSVLPSISARALGADSAIVAGVLYEFNLLVNPRQLHSEIAVNNEIIYEDLRVYNSAGLVLAGHERKRR